MRYFLELAYDGTDYHGWQTQPNARTVQEILDKCLATILQQTIETVGSGRTDTGVHAAQQFVHFELAQALPEVDSLYYRLNRLLPADISAIKLYPVGPEAHARFDAVARTYEYRITQLKNPFLQRYAHYLNRPVNIKLLNEAAAQLLNFEDFTTFSKVKGDTLHYRCQMHAAYWEETENGLRFTIRANRFLRGMVRLIVGTLLDVGTGKISPTDFINILTAQDRRRASGAAPAAGLFLTQVTYPKDFFSEQKEKFMQDKTSALL
ncbi:tRNA pseudouridine synthase A [Adhaeribacter aerolatus]|uniref:tRNA pseudouridine synthase A n=1 Tax=Adhaeribacter aerolatus TaxID=670289 RepID=A0A512AUM4_9BACT|nr:tRNA pseudouridine(38-40) synthase TruA [Adhaeribacter aerolatus]GEO03405.1 tRNA pseudouridine synthase A [Adhaeribacter aerolatus]